MSMSENFFFGLKCLLLWIILILGLWIVTTEKNFESESNVYETDDVHKSYFKHERLPGPKFMHYLTMLEGKLDKALKAANKKAKIVVWSQPMHNPSPSMSLNWSECGACEVTTDKTMVEDPDTKAVLIYLRDKQLRDLPKPRRLDQYYVWWSEESPSSAFIERVPTKEYDNAFNLTMSYRQDSDVFSPYGTATWTLSKIAKNLLENQESISELLTKKKKLGLWIVSNCDYTLGARSRMKFMKQLIHAGLKIDLGGKCFPQGVRDWKFEEYKFYFSFENSLHCRDYITEKFYHNALESGAVPVVFGPDRIDYNEPAAFNNSYIYAEDYSVEGLVEYLNYLDKNDTAYMKYLEWRNIPLSSTRERRRATGFCHLCRMIHGIYFDDVFNQANESSITKYPFFSDKQELKFVKSVIGWWYGTENPNCLSPLTFKRIYNYLPR